jgi:carbon-monoxide dehydrogenase iron sulfur subunit
LNRVSRHRPTMADKKAGRLRMAGDEHPRDNLGRWTIITHPERCTGCGSCEIACSLRRTGQASPANSAIRVVRSDPENVYTPLLCSQCEEAACVRVCPGDALSREKPFGIITLDEARCSQCSSCVLACPLEVLHLGGRKERPQPCDLCGGAPECVASCSVRALEFLREAEDDLKD